MSKKASPALIGAFTIAGLLLIAGALMLFGAGKFFEKTSSILLYFDKSANGLLIGSEVRFGGVGIGRVTSMKVLIDQKGNRKIIPVVVELSGKDLAAVGSTSGNSLDFTTESGVQQAVALALRARMKQQSLLTGQLCVEFDIVPESPGFKWQPDVKPPWPVIPTMNTEMDELISGVAEGLKKFNSLDLTGVIKDLSEVLSSTKAQVAALNLKAINENMMAVTSDLRTLTGNPKLAKAIDSFDEALTGLDALAKKANEGIDPLLKDLERVMRQANAGLVKIDEAAADISKITNPRAPVLMRLQNVLDEAERASRAIKELAIDLKLNPSSLLRGKDSKP